MIVSAEDLLAARAVAVGIGLLGLMITWLVGNRIAAMIWDSPTGPALAMSVAVVSGLVSGLIGHRRLLIQKRLTQPNSQEPEEFVHGGGGCR